MYEEGEHTIRHSHFPSDFSAVYYVDVEPNCAPVLFEVPQNDGVNDKGGNLTLQSIANTALSAPTTGDICMLIENVSGTATLNTDLKAYVSRNGGTGWDQATLVDKGSWGTNKKILTANNVAFSNSASGTDMRYKITTHNQSAGSKETRVHATSLAWA